MPGKIDIQGKRFGRLVVLGPATSKARHTYWNCRCDCGATVTVRTDGLTRGRTASCGCLQHIVVTQHGKWNAAIYRIWHGMMGRCENPHHHAYAYYGGRGIKVYDHWHKFERFLKDMGEPGQGLSLDRIDNDGDYTPENCRWATGKEQARNRRDNRMLEYMGRSLCVAAWAEELRLGHGTIVERLRRGWSIERALSTPVHPY